MAADLRQRPLLTRQPAASALTSEEPHPFHFMPGYVVVIVGFGSAQDHAGVLAPIRAALPPLFEFVTPMPYTQLQQMFDQGTQWGTNCYERRSTSTS